ncbi:uncharacterized protein [Arachis hypogaea]|uniref:uncharacterized protein n=1 Tax=Arachis hypogaea TaxID=3818 RepID=UPI003B22594B
MCSIGSGNIMCVEEDYRIFSSEDKENHLQGVPCGMCMEQQDLNGSLQNYIQTNDCTNLRLENNFGIQSMPSRDATRLARNERVLKLANKKLAKVAQTQTGTNSSITVDRTVSGYTSAQGESLSESLIDKAVLVDLINTSTDGIQWNMLIQEERRAARRDRRQKMQRRRQIEDSPIELGVQIYLYVMLIRLDVVQSLIIFAVKHFMTRLVVVKSIC